MRAWRLTSAALVGVFGFLPLQSATAMNETATVSEARRIIIDPDIYICASVKVSAEIWPLEPWEIREGTGLSSYLINGLRKNFKEAGKLGNATRFRVNDNGRDPVCSKQDTVFINISYESDGGDALLRASVDVIHDDIKWHSAHIINVEEEVKSGRLNLTYSDDQVRRAIYTDLIRSAGEIVATNFVMN